MSTLVWRVGLGSRASLAENGIMNHPNTEGLKSQMNDFLCSIFLNKSSFSFY